MVGCGQTDNELKPGKTFAKLFKAVEELASELPNGNEPTVVKPEFRVKVDGEAVAFVNTWGAVSWTRTGISTHDAEQRALVTEHFSCSR